MWRVGGTGSAPLHPPPSGPTTISVRSVITSAVVISVQLIALCELLLLLLLQQGRRSVTLFSVVP